MAKFNYKKNGTWGNVGWLGRDDYYKFWENVFAKDFAPYFTGKTIIDVGSGNGRVWQDALRSGLSVKALHLIDPALDVAPELSEKPEVILHKIEIEKLQGVSPDVAVFKQSIHHVYEALNIEMFDIIQAKTFINFSMPLDPDWPMSPELKDRFVPSYLNVRKIAENAEKNVIDSLVISCPVQMNRADWCLMLEQRFTSILHDCDNNFIEHEVAWANKNLPNELEFLDHLECLVFG